MGYANVINNNMEKIALNILGFRYEMSDAPKLQEDLGVLRVEVKILLEVLRRAALCYVSALHAAAHHIHDREYRDAVENESTLAVDDLLVGIKEILSTLSAYDSVYIEKFVEELRRDYGLA